MSAAAAGGGVSGGVGVGGVGVGVSGVSGVSGGGAAHMGSPTMSSDVESITKNNIARLVQISRAMIVPPAFNQHVQELKEW